MKTGYSSNPNHPRATLEEERARLIEEYKEIPEAPLDWFFRHCLPNVEESRLNSLKTKLEARPIQGGISKSGKIRGYGTRKPSDITATTKSFKNLDEFIQAVLDNDPAHLSEYKNDTPKTMYSQHSSLSESSRTSRNGGYFFRANQYGLSEGVPTKVTWSMVVAAREDEREYYFRFNNWEKIFWACRRILRNDPCRRFLWGLTCDDNQARIWYFSRSSIIVSEEFDWVINPMPIARFVLSLLFYPQDVNQWKACRAKLGYDPSIDRVEVGGVIQYNITVGDQCYQTLNDISSWKANVIVGRATRVWRVFPLSNPSNRFALKDVWLEDKSSTEGQILGDIRSDIEARNPEDLADFGKYYLQLEIEMHVPLDTEIPAVDTIDGMLSLERADEDEDGDHEPSPTPSRRRERYRPRNHYRSIWKDVDYLTVLNELTDQRHMLTVVRDLNKALKILWRTGRTHCDISPGNAYCYKNGNKIYGKLGDFEYVKKYEKTGTDDLIMGTPNFWSVEVELRQYRFYLSYPRVNAPFLHNPIHDIESLLWLSLWIFVGFKPVLRDPTNLQVAQLSALNKICYDYYLRIGSSDYFRMAIIIRPGRHSLISRNYKIFENQWIGYVLVRVTQMASTIYTMYKNAEEIFSSFDHIPSQTFEGLHDIIHEELDTFVTYVESTYPWEDVGVRPIFQENSRYPGPDPLNDLVPAPMHKRRAKTSHGSTSPDPIGGSSLAAPLEKHTENLHGSTSSRPSDPTGDTSAVPPGEHLNASHGSTPPYADSGSAPPPKKRAKVQSRLAPPRSYNLRSKKHAPK